MTSAGREADALPMPTAFGDEVTADHKVLNEGDVGRDAERYAVIMQDNFTYWLQAYPVKSKSGEATTDCFQQFFGPQSKPKHLYSDNSGEIQWACQQLSISQDTATPHRPETNAKAERAVRRVKEGTSCVLTQSGLSEVWWPFAMRCYCFQRNAVDLLRSEMSAWKARFGEECAAPMIPFGASIEYNPITEKDQARVHQFGVKTLKGIFMGYEQQAGGGWGSKDLLIIDSEELENAEHTSEVKIKRFRASEIIAVMEDDSFSFPVAEGNLSQPGFARVQPRRVRRRPAPAAAPGDGERDEGEEAIPEPARRNPVPPLPPPEPDFWTLTEHQLVRHHRTSRNTTFVPTPENCPIPLRYLDVMRMTSTDLDPTDERLFEDEWPTIRERELSDYWTGKTIFFLLKPKPPRGYTWV